MLPPAKCVAWELWGNSQTVAQTKKPRINRGIRIVLFYDLKGAKQGFFVNNPNDVEVITGG
jgi:hypothetical protein